MSLSPAPGLSLPFLTSDLPGAGGQLKLEAADFEVEELPAYELSGEGEHLFLWVEKIGHDSQWVARELARAAGIDVREVGVAGQKDRRAVTRQLFSLPARTQPKLEAALPALAEQGTRVLWTKRHGNKLRTGHLKGNRFLLRLRGVRDVQAARAVVDRLQAVGVPNYFGAQRFGRAGDNAQLGRALLKGERLPKKPDRFERKLFLSALQSALFNDVLAERIRRGELSRALTGDVLRKHESGGAFVCEDAQLDQSRVEALEVSPTGPLFGPKMLEPKGEPAAMEAAVLERWQLTRSDFLRGGDETQGARRALRIPIQFDRFEPIEAAEGGEGAGTDLRVAFALPKGSYATVVLRELIKDEPAAELDSAD